jgi:PAS domain-containing protein
MKTKEIEIHPTAYLNGLPQPVLTTDNEGVILYCNRAVEKLFTTQSDKLINRNIGEFLQSTESTKGLSDIIKNLDLNRTLCGQYFLKIAGSAVKRVSISISGVANDEKRLAGTIISFQEDEKEKLIISQLDVIKKTLSSLTDDYLANINKLTALCGELLGASSALYNRLNEGLLCSLGKWNTAPDHIPVVKPEGRICYDVIRNAKDGIYMVRNLPETTYAHSDPNVLLYDLKTYIGHMVRCNGEPIGSLCVVFQHDCECNENVSYLISLLALAIEGEETRESFRKSTNRYRELFDLAVEGILVGSHEGIITDSNNSISQMTGFKP